MSADSPAVFEQLPPGFRKVSVIFSDAEFERLCGRSCRMPDGTFSEAIRNDLGLSYAPYGLKVALARQAQLND